MLFNSAVFLLLFLAFYLLYWPLPIKWKHSLIILASVLFYLWYDFYFLLLFLFILGFSYIVSLYILKKRSQVALVLGLIVVIGNLCFFKYFYLFAQSIGSMIGDAYLADLRINWKRDYQFSIVLPIAISFYTFQIVAYLVDCYRGTIPERIPLRKYIVFILYFPQFIAGPIMRSTDFIGQIDNPRASRDGILNGCLLILQGIVKKVLIADQIGAALGPVFAAPAEYDALILLILIPGFICQIYADFSGYTDMARGMSKMLGYEIPENFLGPFLAESMSELWRRWHITLSTWLRDYIYIPLGGSRGSEVRVNLNLLVTMGLGGLWHGADWSMVVWGLYMGTIICIERYMRVRGIRILPDTRSMHVVRVVWTFFLFGISGILFASPDIERVIQIVTGIFTFQSGQMISKSGPVLVLSVLTIGFNFIQVSDKLKRMLMARVGLRYFMVSIGLLIVGLLVSMFGDTSGSFIYFSF